MCGQEKDPTPIENLEAQIKRTEEILANQRALLEKLRADPPASTLTREDLYMLT